MLSMGPLFTPYNPISVRAFRRLTCPVALRLTIIYSNSSVRAAARHECLMKATFA